MTMLIDETTGEPLVDINIPLLTEEFPNNALMHREGPGGKQFTYVSTATVIRRLNRATGNHWSFAVMNVQFLGGGVRTDRNNNPNPEQVMLVHGRLTIPGLGSRDGFGVQRLPDPIVNADDLLKAASGDALKRAAVSFGVAIELYGEDMEAEDYTPPRPQQRPPQQAPQQRTPAQQAAATGAHEAQPQRPQQRPPQTVGNAPGQDPNGTLSPYEQVYDLYTKMADVHALMTQWGIPVTADMKMPDCMRAVNGFIKRYYNMDNAVVPTGLYNPQYKSNSLRPCDIANALHHFVKDEAQRRDPAPEATKAAAAAAERDTAGEFDDVPF